MRLGRRFKLALIYPAGAACALMCAPSAARASTLTENFTTLDHWDISATQATGSAGLWNINSGQGSNPGPCAMVPVMDGGNANGGAANNPINFGNGSDGALDSSNGYAFDTDAHPSGYNFTSVNITGGAITVTGTNPLRIYSLTNVNITPSIILDGGNGIASASGGAGGTAPATNQGAGGTGGAAGVVGSTGHIPDGSASGGSAGSACASSPGACGAGGVSFTVGTYNSSDGTSGDFDSASGFTAGGGGGGGGGNSTAPGEVGGGGGAGGGALQITALGTINVGTLSANGGAGGSNGTSGSGCNAGTSACSGSGGAGNGGSIWLQSFNGTTVGSANANPGSAGLGNGGGSGQFGNVRGDDPTAGVAPDTSWATGGEGTNGTGAAGEIPALSSTGTYYVVSTAYDLQTNNATFSTPIVTQSGGATVQYAGSSDGTTFGSWTSDITSLSNRDYRYVKFKITLPASSHVSSISIPFGGPSLNSADLGLAAGCGGLERIRSGESPSDRGHSDKTGAMMIGFWALLYLLAWKTLTGSRRYARYR